MRKTIAALLLTALSQPSFAYNIGGMYATLIECRYGNFHYQYGNIGIYMASDGNLYSVFFGSMWCEY